MYAPPPNASAGVQWRLTRARSASTVKSGSRGRSTFRTTICRSASMKPRDRSLVIHCATGVRSQIAASLLERHNFADFAHVEGGLDAWIVAGLPVKRVRTQPHPNPSLESERETGGHLKSPLLFSGEDWGES
ncbi:rhodanese-like domain-containing protein [Candidatus Flexifilum breve]|uniref:rhodanese-like domain-containing protein n=1 Tax=Candidatus Flexifilum breve TaxID=3140694 RepID=UPI003312FA97